MKHFETIEKYLDGAMTDAEKQSFEARLESDSGLKKEFVIQKLEREAIDELAEQSLLEEIKSIRAEQQSGSGDSTRKGGSVIRYLALAIAAGLFLALGYFALIQPGGANTRQMAMTYYEDYSPNFSASRSTEDAEIKQEMLTILERRDASSIDAVIDYFKDNPEPGAEYFLGHAYFIKGNYNRAVTTFDQYLANTDVGPETIAKAEFYRSLALLAAGRNKKGTVVLEAIIADPGHPFHGIAQEILADLE